MERPEADLVLLAVRLNREVLADTFEGYLAPGGVLVPLGALAGLLELDIRADVARGVAEGSFIDGRLFHLDARRRQVVVAGRTLAVRDGQIEVHADDIYVHTESISEWLPLDLDLDLRSARLTVRPREPLPVEKRRDRQERARKALAGVPRKTDNFPRWSLPHRFLAGPFLDLSALASSTPEAGGRGIQYTAFFTGELLFMESTLRVAGSDREPFDRVRGALARRDPRGGVLGPLRARELVLGDVFDSGLDLIALPRSGPGALLSNFPLERQSEFDRHSFQGELALGWEVELYRNDDFVAYEQSRPDGRYEFPEVPLLFGLNVFRLVFYGPQGQRRTETRRFNVGESLTPAGHLSYRLVGNRPESGGERASAELDFGLFSRLSLNVAGAQVRLPGDDEARRYGRAGLRGYWGWLFANVDYAQDDTGGRIAQAGLQTRLGSLGLSLRHAELDGFRSERFLPQPAPVRRRSLLRMDGAIPRWFLPRLPLTLEGTRDEYTNGASQTRLSQRLSVFHRRQALSNQLTWTVLDDASGARQSLATGSLLLSRFTQGLAVRGELQYEVKPSAELTGMALTVESRVLGGYLLSAGVNHRLRDNQTRYLAGVNKSVGAFGFGLKADYAQPGGLGLALALQLGLSRDGMRFYSDARTVAESGAISARVFLDSDADGVFDPGERLLPDVAFVMNGGSVPGRTGAGGTLFASHIPAYRETALSIVPSTLEDAMWGVTREGVRIVPRPGRVARVDFPVVAQGEVVGTVYERRGDVTREAAGIDVELLDAGGRVVKRTTTAFDGFFDLTALRPGSYVLRAGGERLVSRGLVQGGPRKVIIAADGTILDGVDLVLTGTGTAAAEGNVVTELPPIPEPAVARPTPVPTKGPRASSWPPGPAGRPGHAVQVASFQDRVAADREAGRIVADTGRHAYVRAVALGPRGTWYRVLVGGFESPAEAQAYRAQRSPRARQPAIEPMAARRALPMQSREWTAAPTYAVQLASFGDREVAMSEAAGVKAHSGVALVVLGVDLPGRGRWHRVLVVGFGTLEEAYAYRATLRTQPGPVYYLESSR